MPTAPLPESRRRLAFRRLTSLIRDNPTLRRIGAKVADWSDPTSDDPPGAATYWVRLTPQWTRGNEVSLDGGQGHRDVQNVLRISVEVSVPGPDICDLDDIAQVIEQTWMPDADRRVFDAALLNTYGISDIEVASPLTAAPIPPDWPGKFYGRGEVVCSVWVRN